MKKLCSVICAASVALSLAVPAFATEQTSILGSTPGEVAVVEELLKNPEATPGEVETSEDAGNTTEITESVEINETNFPDAIFRQYVTRSFDEDEDGVLSPEEIAGATSINVNGLPIPGTTPNTPTSLKGIEFFVNLEELDCWYVRATELDLSKNTKLRSLSCENSWNLTKLDLSNNPNLEFLYCMNTKITELDLSKNTKLKALNCNSCSSLTKLDISNSPNLNNLRCGSTKISELDVSKNVALGYLYCGDNQISKLDVSKNVALEFLECSYTQISELDVSKNVALEYLSCNNTQINELDVSNNPNLEILNLPHIRSLKCYGTKITQLDLGYQSSLQEVYQDFLAVKTERDVVNEDSTQAPKISYLEGTDDHRATYTIDGDTFTIKEKATTFDAANVKDMQVSNGATWNPETGAIENIQNGRTEVSYQYVTGGTYNGEPIVATLGFILERTGAPTPTATPAPTAQPTATPAPTAQPTATPAPTAQPSATPAPTSAPVPTATPAPTAQPTATPVPTGAPVPTATPVPGTPGEITGDKADQLLKDPNNTQLANEIVTQINYERYMNVTSKVATAVANAIRYNPMNLGASKDGIQFGATLHKDNSGFVLVPESAAIEGNRAQVSLHFEDGKGNVVQPKLGGLVTVKIAGKTMPAGDYVLVGEGNRMIDSVTVTTVGNDTVISFWAPHFSTYAIVPRSAYVAPSDNNNGGGTVGNPIKATGLDMSMALMGVVAMAGVAVVGGAAVAKKAKKD